MCQLMEFLIRSDSIRLAPSNPALCLGRVGFKVGGGDSSGMNKFGSGMVSHGETEDISAVGLSDEEHTRE